MLSHGDELGRTQQGNNNAYCQDNELSWVDWSDVRENWLLLEFTQRLAKLRARPSGLPAAALLLRPAGTRPEDELSDIAWLTPAGEKMTDADWNVGYAKSLAVFLNGEAITEPDRRGRPIMDDSFLLLFNAHHDDIQFTIPKDYGEMWLTEIDTAMPITLDARVCRAGEGVAVAGRCGPGAAGVSRPSRGAAPTSTYRLQLTPDFGFAAGGRARALPAGPRRQPRLPVADPAGRARVRGTATT